MMSVTTSQPDRPLGFTVPAAQYLEQLRLAGDMERAMNQKLADEGWQWQSELGCWRHPERPGQEIWPG